jgi:hypothetical protein
MAYIYPRNLVFGLDPDDVARRLAIVRAADALELPCEIVGATIRVTITSPQVAYRFGQQTRAFMAADKAPPIPEPPAADVDAH